MAQWIRELAVTAATLVISMVQVRSLAWEILCAPSVAPHPQKTNKQTNKQKHPNQLGTILASYLHLTLYNEHFLLSKHGLCKMYSSLSTFHKLFTDFSIPAYLCYT